LIGRSLERAYAAGDDLSAREDMAYGSLMAGMAMASARLGGVHGMAHPLGSHFSIPHGVICGLLLPYTMEYNLAYAGKKYAEVYRLMGGAASGEADADARAAVEGVRGLLGRIGIPTRLRDYGVGEEHLPQIIDESLPSGSLQHNPRPLAAEDVRAILEAAL
ncbi:MAG: iron-containing alcohol dehydrogenase, partial [Chloroflexi bacterium]|nr:iron-containing alcohol dehydrogenase [Chloroflexota bacterium]